MAMTEHDEAYVMDLTALLKAFRKTRQEAAQVGQQLREQQQTCRDLAARATHMLTETGRPGDAPAGASAHQRADGGRDPAPVGGPAAAVAAGGAGAAVIAVEGDAPAPRGHVPGECRRHRVVGGQLATERRELRQATALATDLDRYLRETLYAQLSTP